MKSIFLLIFLASLVCVAPASAQGGSEKPADIRIKVGESFDLAVPDQSGSTGYVVMLRNLPPFLALVSTETTVPESSKGVPGAPFVKVFTLVGVSPGQGQVEINAARLWEKPIQWAHTPKDADANLYFYQIEVSE